MQSTKTKLTAMRFSLFASLLLVPAVRAVFPANVAFPDVIDLPVGFFPEGIEIGDGHDVYVGSIRTGAIWKGSLQDGTGDLLVKENGRTINGVKYDKRSRSLYAAGRDSGKGYRYDGDTGELLNEFEFVDNGFVNDIVITKDAAYFTDSFNAQLYVLPLTNQGVIAGPHFTLTLGCDFESDANARINANGIEVTQDGKLLIIVNSATGLIYTVDPTDGCATEINLGGDNVKTADGLVLSAHTLYAVENRNNRIAKIALAPDFASGVVVTYLTNSEFDVPTTAALFGNSLYTPNAKFNIVDNRADTPYEIVRTGL
jgi:sugar lactone lactonase YvrE